MRYATLEQFRVSLRQYQASELEREIQSSQASPAFLEYHLDLASSEIDSYIGKIYALPLQIPFPSILEDWCIAIALWNSDFLGIRRAFIEDEYRRTLFMLQKISKGDFVLLSEAGVEPAKIGEVAGGTGMAPAFNLEDLEFPSFPCTTRMGVPFGSRAIVPSGGGTGTGTGTGTEADLQSIQELRAILATMDARIQSLQTQVARNPAEISQRITPVDGQTLFNVDPSIMLAPSTEVFVNGVKYYYALDYTLDDSRKTLTWLNRQFQLSSLYVLEIFG